MRLLLDAGHGGRDPGATVTLEDGVVLRESTVALETVMTMKLMLCSYLPLWDIMLTRRDDTYISPSARVRMIKKYDATALVSVHFNSAGTSRATGHEVLYRDDVDKPLAVALNDEMRSLPLRDRGLKKDITDLHRSLALLNTPPTPTVIVEPGFLTNATDRAVITDSSMLAALLVEGITRWAQEYVS